MSTFNDLPNELVQNICELGGSKVTCLVRTMNRALAKAAWHPFTSHFTTLKIISHPLSLKLLEKIALEKNLAAKVERLIIDMENLHRDLHLGGDESEPLPSDQQSQLEEHIKKLREEQQRAIKSGDIDSVLRGALDLFPNLRSIKLDDAHCVLNTSKWTPFLGYATIKNLTGLDLSRKANEHWASNEEDSTSRRLCFESALKTLHNFRRINEITVDMDIRPSSYDLRETQRRPMPAFDVAKLDAKVWRRLRTVNLFNDTNSIWCLELLTKLAQSPVEELSSTVMPARKWTTNPGMHAFEASLLTPTNFSNLRRLRLEGGVFIPEVFTWQLPVSAPNLVSVAFVNLCIYRNTHELFRELKTLPKLESVSLQNVKVSQEEVNGVNLLTIQDIEWRGKREIGIALETFDCDVYSEIDDSFLDLKRADDAVLEYRLSQCCDQISLTNRCVA